MSYLGGDGHPATCLGGDDYVYLPNARRTANLALVSRIATNLLIVGLHLIMKGCPPIWEEMATLLLIYEGDGHQSIILGEKAANSIASIFVSIDLPIYLFICERMATYWPM